MIFHHRKLSAILCPLLILTIFACLATRAAEPSPESKKKYSLAFESALVKYEKAGLYYKDKKIPDAIRELEELVAIKFPAGFEDSDGFALQLDTYAFLGELYLEIDKPQKALDAVGKGLDKAPGASKQTYQLYMTMGHIYKETGDNDKALKAFKQADKINASLRKASKK